MKHRLHWALTVTALAVAVLGTTQAGQAAHGQATAALAAVGIVHGKPGPRGLPGPRGPVGPRGFRGPQGPAGPAGAKGPVGEMGTPGAVGDTGPVGAQGAKGQTGDAGTQGTAGSTGAVGPEGQTGDTGAKGQTGNAGTAGAKGQTGDTGPKGAVGDAGTTGAKGQTGDTGSTGATGATGAAGAFGIVWRGVWSSTAQYLPGDAVSFQGSSYIAKSANVAATPPGTAWDLDAALGDTGAHGADGADLVPFALPGDLGAPGATGDPGAQGAQGPTGPRGDSLDGNGYVYTAPATVTVGGNTVVAQLTPPAGSYFVTASLDAATSPATVDRLSLVCFILVSETTSGPRIVGVSPGAGATLTDTVEGPVQADGSIRLECRVQGGNGTETVDVTNISFTAMRLTSLTQAGSYRSTVLADDPTYYWGMGAASGNQQPIVGGEPLAYFGTGGSYASPGALARPQDYGSFTFTDSGSFRSDDVGPLSGPFTLEAWYRFHGTDFQNEGIGGRWVSGVGGAFLWLDPDGHYTLVISGDPANYAHSTLAPSGQYDYVVGTWDGTTAKLYVNGQLVASQPFSGPLGNAGTNPFMIGDYSNGDHGRIEGDIDEFAIYGSALSQAQIQAHYQAATTP